MKQNFSNFDFKKVFNTFNGNIFNVRFNKAGNITLDVKNGSVLNTEHPHSNHKFTFYSTPNGVLIRHISNWSVFPLNMSYKSRHIDKETWGGYTHDVYNIKYSNFENIDDAIVYFIEYLNLYHNIINF